MNRTYLVRQGGGPIIVPGDLPCEANAVLNPGVVEVNGEVVLLLRVECKDGRSHIRVAKSSNGVDNWQFSDRALLEPGLPDYPYEEWGCEDARVTRTGDTEWAIMYTAFSRKGPVIALATTSDFVNVNRLGPAFFPGNKDAALFPEKFGGEYLMLHRPEIGGEEDIWFASTSDHLVRWSQPGLLMERRGGPYWDGERIGAGCPPIRTEDGWLLIYHGTKAMGGHSAYRLGIALLDLNDPRCVIARADDWVFAAEADYEQRGLMPSVVFTCGALVRGDELWLYYGAADTSVGLAIGKIESLLALLR